MIQDVLTQLTALSVMELAAVLLAIAYLLLAIRENIWCWLCAGASTAIYVVLFAEAKLYMESLLNIFYFAMAVYGWRVWSTGLAATARRAVVTWPIHWHAQALGAILVFSAATGYALDTQTDAAYPYIDDVTFDLRY